MDGLIMVSVLTWLVGMPIHAEGVIMLYGADYLAEANARYHGYSLDGYECGLAVMSPTDLGKTVWIRGTKAPASEFRKTVWREGRVTGWIGPCLAVDVGARKDFYTLIWEKHEVAEVTYEIAARLGFDRGGVWGETWVGNCPPRDKGEPERYEPELILEDSDFGPVPMRPFPKQVFPRLNCSRR